MFGRKKRELEAQVARLEELRRFDAQEISQLKGGYASIELAAATGSWHSSTSRPREFEQAACAVSRVRNRALLAERRLAEEQSGVANLQRAHDQVVEQLKKRNVALEEQRNLLLEVAIDGITDTAGTKAEMPGFVRHAAERIIANHGGAEARADLAAATERHGIVKKRLEEQVEYLADVKNQRDHALALLATQVDGVTETTARHLAKGEEIAEKRELVVAVDRLTGAVRFGFEHPDTVS